MKRIFLLIVTLMTAIISISLLPPPTYITHRGRERTNSD